MDNNQALNLKRKSRSRLFGLCLISALLLTLSFPRFFGWFLAWFGLIPFFYCLDTQKPAGGFKAGFLFGLLFFSGIFSWLFHLTSWFSLIAFAGVFLLLLYLSLYMAVFGCVYCWMQKYSPLRRLFLLPCVWVCLEYMRSNFLSGFGWGFLGHTQYQNLAVIQIADMTGVYGISFLICMSNVYLKEIYKMRMDAIDRIVYRLCFYSVLLFILGYGFYTILRYQEKPLAKVAVVQGNISQDLKWSPGAWDVMLERHTKLTLKAARDRPDLIVWPETSLPGFLGSDKEVYARLKALAQHIQIPMLVGVVLKTRLGQYYNTAFLIDGNGNAQERYSKIHLVPFGEFLPFRQFIPDGIEEWIPVSDFSAGRTYTTFQVPGMPIFSTLICFEDTVPRLVRRFAQKHGGFFINLTNDGWFKDSAAPFMHMQTAMFRAVEHRRSLVRATNTGVSGFVDPLGRITPVVQDLDGQQSYVHGWVSGYIQAGKKSTLYTKYGNVFTFLCFLCILWGIYPKKKENFL